MVHVYDFTGLEVLSQILFVFTQRLKNLWNLQASCGMATNKDLQDEQYG